MGFYVLNTRNKVKYTVKRVWGISYGFISKVSMWIVLMIWASNGRSEKTVIVQQNAVPQKSAQESFEELKRLKDMGMLTDEEFEAKRKELLTRI